MKKKKKKSNRPFTSVRRPPFLKVGRPLTTKHGARGYTRKEDKTTLKKDLEESEEE